MTDARFPERWLNDRRIIRLTDAEFRTFTLATAWSVANRSDGYLHSGDLDLIHGATTSAAGALVAAGLWNPAVDGYQIVDFTVTQTSRDQLDGLDLKKAQDRDRAKAYRARKKPESSRLSRDSSRDDIGQARLGQEGQAGQEDVQGGQEGTAASDASWLAGSSEPVTCSACAEPIPPEAWYARTGRHPGCQVREAS